MYGDIYLLQGLVDLNFTKKTYKYTNNIPILY